jgi:hypothetical protein
MKKQLFLLIALIAYTANSFTDAGPTFNNNITFQTLNTSTNKTENTILAVQQTISSDMLKELAHGSGSFMNNNKLLVAAIAGTYAYGRTFVSVVKANHELGRETAWAVWKAEFSLDSLKSQDQETLTKELLFEIQKRHTSADKPADALMPFITFLGVVDEEIASLNHYRSMHFWLESCHSTWLFPVNKNRFACASSRLERLWFIKNLFLTWAAEYKLSTLASRSALSTLSRLYRYFADKLNSIIMHNNGSFSSNNELVLDRPATDKNARTKTLLFTLAETACCAQLAALIGAALTPSAPINRVFSNTIQVSM